MLQSVTTTFAVPDWISNGLTQGVYERVGGVIRNTNNKEVIVWLRETTPTASFVPGLLANAATLTGVANLGVSVLGLGVSIMGFLYLSMRLKELEKTLQEMREVLEKVNHKVDLGFHANFLAAIDLATNAFTMDNPDNRRNSALQAINRFLEAEHIYTNLFDQESEPCGQIIDSYLSTLSLAYVAEARCYLELGEHNTAIRRFQEGKQILRTRIEKYVNCTLTANPAIYLQPELKGLTDLRRLTEIYHWMNPSLKENDVFELQRENFVEFVKHPHKSLNALPKPMLLGIKNKKDFPQYLPKFLEMAESMIETNDRFEAYEMEVKAIAQLGITFHEWQQLQPSEPTTTEQTVMLIIPSKPITIQ
jgi:tetratricopeptide (TPR) repeat protein